MSVSERFWAKVDKSGECWLWKASKNLHGYGQLMIARKPLGAHRVAWELANGPIPAGMCVCHRCDTPACVRPDHLFLGTHTDNMRDMFSKKRRKTAPTRGELNGNSRLTRQQAEEIRWRVYACWPIRVVGREFRIAQCAVQRIARGLGWK